MRANPEDHSDKGDLFRALLASTMLPSLIQGNRYHDSMNPSITQRHTDIWQPRFNRSTANCLFNTAFPFAHILHHTHTTRTHTQIHTRICVCIMYLTVSANAREPPSRSFDTSACRVRVDMCVFLPFFCQKGWRLYLGRPNFILYAH
jgi:hypothetical protein